MLHPGFPKPQLHTYRHTQCIPLRRTNLSSICTVSPDPPGQCLAALDPCCIHSTCCVAPLVLGWPRTTTAGLGLPSAPCDHICSPSRFTMPSSSGYSRTARSDLATHGYFLAAGRRTSFIGPSLTLRMVLGIFATYNTTSEPVEMPSFR